MAMTYLHGEVSRFPSFRISESKEGLKQQADLFICYFGSYFSAVDSQLVGQIKVVLREIFDEFISSSHSNREYRLLANTLETHILYKSMCVRNATFRLAKILLKVVNVNLIARKDLPPLFEYQECLGDFLNLGAKIGLSENELRDGCQCFSWAEFSIDSENCFVQKSGILWNENQRISVKVDSKWWSLTFLRLFSLFKSSRDFPRASIRAFKLVETALSIDVGEGDVNGFIRSLEGVAVLCSQYEETLGSIDMSKRNKSSAAFETKLQGLIKQMKQYALCKGPIPEKDSDAKITRLKRRILRAVKGEARMGILPKLLRLVNDAALSRDSLCFAFVETLIEASIRVIDKGESCWGSLVSLANCIGYAGESFPSGGQEEHRIVISAILFAHFFGIQLLSGNFRVLEALSPRKGEFLLIAQIIDATLVLTKRNWDPFHFSSALLKLMFSGYLEKTLLLFTHCLKSDQQSALLCPLSWLEQWYTQNEHSLKEDPDLYVKLNAQFFPHDTHNLLNLKLPKDVSYMVEEYFGFPKKLAEISNRIRFLRTKYKWKLNWNGYAVSETCMSEESFLYQVTHWFEFGSVFHESDDIHVRIADALSEFGESETPDPNNLFFNHGRGIMDYHNFNPFLSPSRF